MQQQTSFGELLRHHRRARGFSQLQLSLEADVSTRHLSFVETGRAGPSRELVVALSTALDVPLRDRNRLLEAAGFAPQYRETPLAAPAMSEMRRAVELILRRHEPFGAVALDRHWNVVIANDAYAWVHNGLLGGPPLAPYVVAESPQVNALRTFFHPDGFRRHLSNWKEVARAMVPRVLREAAHGDETVRALVDEVLAYPGVPKGSEDDLASILIPLVLRIGDAELRMFTTIATLGTAQDITLQELRIESFHPADDASEAMIRAIRAA